MKKFLFITFLLFVSGDIFAQNNVTGNAEEEFTPRRGWMIKTGYANQIDRHWIEAGIGRMNLIGMRSGNKPGSFISAAAGAFTLGGEYCLTSSKPIYGAKLAIEGNAILFGGRASYALYFSDGRESGVTTIEGGLCLLSVVYVYAGYNFADQPLEQQVVHEGFRLSAGINFPLGIKPVKTNLKLENNN
jgi:hypothetical protein